MRYKCKLVVNNNLNNDCWYDSEFTIILKYKKQGELFYKRMYILGTTCSLDGAKLNKTFNYKLDELADMGDEEFMEYLKRLLRQEINKNSKADKLDDDFTNKINILQKRSGKFFIDI